MAVIPYNGTPKPPTWDGFDKVKTVAEDTCDGYTATFIPLESQEVRKDEHP